ncbi:hypothetical protein Trydic_g6973 [Trypoxylus dichotomus]
MLMAKIEGLYRRKLVKAERTRCGKSLYVLCCSFFASFLQNPIPRNIEQIKHWTRHQFALILSIMEASTLF